MGSKSKYLPTLDKKAIEQDYDSYILQIIYELQNYFSDLSDQIDGSIKSSYYQQKELWTPLLKGTTNSGSFTYGNQIGWVYRQGLIVDIWCDISWTATGGATGNLYLELPYRVANTTGKPFIGCVQYSNIALGAGNTCLFVDAIGDTYRADIWQSGSGIAITNLTVQPSGELKIHLRYLGIRDE